MERMHQPAKNEKVEYKDPAISWWEIIPKQLQLKVTFEEDTAIVEIERSVYDWNRGEYEGKTSREKVPYDDLLKFAEELKQDVEAHLLSTAMSGVYRESKT